MIIRLFRDNQTFVVFICFLTAVTVWIVPGFYSKAEPSLPVENYSALFIAFPEIYILFSVRWIAAFLNAFLLFICGLYISGIVLRYQVIPRRTALPMFLFILLSTPFFTRYNGFSFPLLTFLLLLVILDMVFSSIDNKRTSMRFFDCALILSVASLINVYFIFFILFLVFVWIQFRTENWRELIYLIIGLILPYVFYIAVLYIADKNIFTAFYAVTHVRELRFSLSVPENYINGAFFLLFFLMIASVHILKQYGKMKIITRKYSLIFLSLFLTILITLFLFRAVDTDFIFYLAFPVSFLFSYYFSTCRLTPINQILLLIIIILNSLVLFIPA